MLGYFSFNTAAGKEAISENHLKENPNGSQATHAASIPEQTLPTVFTSIAISPRGFSFLFALFFDAFN
jgi:hypothetical protein